MHESDGKATNEWNELKIDNDPASRAIGDYQPGSAAEKKLLRKLDSRIIVCVLQAIQNSMLIQLQALCMVSLPSRLSRSSEYWVRALDLGYEQN